MVMSEESSFRRRDSGRSGLPLLQFSRIQAPRQHQQAFKKIIISYDELAFVCRILRSGVWALVEAALCEYSVLSFVLRRNRRQIIRNERFDRRLGDRSIFRTQGGILRSLGELQQCT